MLRTVVFTLSLCLAAGAVKAEPFPFELEDGKKMTAELFRPKGEGPFPAVILLHTCSGPKSKADWGPWLAAQGYVVFLPDSFTNRNYPNGVCELRGETVTENRRGLDAIALADAIYDLPFIQPGKIALLGFSHGAGGVLAALGLYGDKSEKLLTGGIAYYPRCREIYANLEKPTLILIGDADDWTPLRFCTEMQKVMPQAAKANLELVVYSGATHNFDRRGPEIRMNGIAPGGQPGTFVLRHDAKATEDAEARVLVMLAKLLKP